MGRFSFRKPLKERTKIQVHYHQSAGYQDLQALAQRLEEPLSEHPLERDLQGIIQQLEEEIRLLGVDAICVLLPNNDILFASCHHPEQDQQDMLHTIKHYLAERGMP